MHWNHKFCRANLWAGLVLLLCSPAQWAANIPITIAGRTETQIAISYTPTSSAACTITATDKNGGPAVADLDPSKFANASTDLGRTAANGFRWPTLTSGSSRTVFIGGHDEIKQGLDGKWYSTALQVASQHTITVTCNGGVDSGTVAATTANLPLASYYPEMPIPTPGSPLGGLPQAYIDYSVLNYKTNDPITGVMIQALSAGNDSFNDNEPQRASWEGDVLDVNGGAWTNPANFITNQAPATLATTTTANAPLFVPFAANWPGEWYTDLTVVPYGNASANTVVSEWCLSTDSGQTCANFTPIDVTYSTGAGCQPTGTCSTSVIPSPTPSSMFSGWGGMKGAYGMYDLINQQVSGVSTSGHLVTATIPHYNWGFNLERVPGSKFKLSSCSSGSGGIFTVNHTDAEGQITMVESATNSNCTYTDLGVGLRVILKNSGTLNVSLTASEWGAHGASVGSNGNKWICARQKVTDIQTGCDGVTRSPAIGGYLCGLASEGIYVIQDDGQMCIQSTLYSPGGSFHLVAEAGAQISPISANSFLLTGYMPGPYYPGQHVAKLTHVPNNYQVFGPDPTHSQTDRFTYVDLSAITTPIATQIANAGGTEANALATGFWPALYFDGVIENGSGGATIQYRTSFQQDTQCMLAWADAATNLLLSTNAVYGSYPFSYSSCHFSVQGAAGYAAVGAEADSYQLSPIFFNSSVPLGGPFTSNVLAMDKNGTMATHSLTISSCTNASPAVCTAANHDIDQVDFSNSSRGVYATISGATGGWTALNGAKYLHYATDSTFTVYTDSIAASPLNATGFGSFSGSVTASMAPALYSIGISSVTNNGVSGSNGSGYARITGWLAGGYAMAFPSGNLVVQDGDPIAINSNQIMSSTTQYYAKVSCTGCSSTQFDMYSNSSLTTPVPYSTLSAYNSGGYVMYAETCPAQSSVTLPGPMFMDTTPWTSGTPKVRCVTLQLNGEFLSDYPATGETAAYPAPGSGNTGRSMLHPINVGDGLITLRSYPYNQWEVSYVLSVDRTSSGLSENKLNVVVERNYGDAPGYNWRGTTEATDYYGMEHGYGWTAWAASIVPGGLVNTNASPNTYAMPPVNGSHSDFVPGQTNGNVSAASAYGTGNPDSEINVPVATYAQPGSFAHTSIPFFSQSGSYSLMCFGGECGQSYPSLRWRGDQAPASEHFWNSDWMAQNVSNGQAQNNGDGTGLGSTLLNISGTTYDSGGSTTMVYKIPEQSAVNEKIAPLLVTAVPHVLFVDKSGPGSLITDADIGKRCTAFTAGECRPNSVPGDTFIAGRGWYTSYGQCISNTSTLGSPCAFGIWPGGGWAVQVRDTPLDRSNTGVRRLTLGFWTPPNHYSFSNWVSTPDAKWGIFAPNSVQQRSGSTQWFAMKLPPWPNFADNTNRTTFVPVAVRFPATPGASIRIAFGYAENGNPASLYCTTRQETCWTSAGATATSPFLFASEAQQKVACGSGCTVSIPAIQGRILFYEVEHTTSAGTVTDPLQAIALQ